MKLKNKVFIPIVFITILLSQQIVNAQTKYLIIDKNSGKPIPFVGIYAKNGKNILGANSDEFGRFEINFPFDTLFFTHINYAKIGIAKQNLRQTVELIPSSIILNEIVIGNNQPKWINRILKEVVKQKYRNYRTTTKELEYNFDSATLSDSSAYSFSSNGVLLVPSLKEEKYSISIKQNTIRYKDTTAGPDLSLLNVMIEDDFIQAFDGGFIKKNKFFQNYWPENTNKNLVQVMFVSEKFKDDEGYMVIDTLNKVILEYDRKSGTEFNVQTKTPLVLRLLLQSYVNLKYKTWSTQYHVKYSKIGNCYQASEHKYKMNFRVYAKHKNKTYNYFSIRDAKLALTTKESPNKTSNFHQIPKLFYIKIMSRKKEQEDENLYQKGPTKFERF